jgi:hypothetical protein
MVFVFYVKPIIRRRRQERSLRRMTSFRSGRTDEEVDADADQELATAQV